MGAEWARLGLAIGGALLGGWMLPLGGLGAPLGWLAGSYIGSMIFPTEYNTQMPPVGDYPIQSSAIGTPIPIVFGTSRLAGNIIWMGKLDSYQVKHSAGGGKGGGGEQAAYETRYRRSFLIALCEGPATILRAWKGKTEISLSEFTAFEGDENTGIGTLIGEDYAEYSNLCLAYFEHYELGNSQTIPNFIFEVNCCHNKDEMVYSLYVGTDEAPGGDDLFELDYGWNKLYASCVGDSVNGIYDIVIQPSTNRIIVAGTQVRIYESSWAYVGTLLAGTTTTMLIDPDDDDYIYCCGASGIWKYKISTQALQWQNTNYSAYGVCISSSTGKLYICGVTGSGINEINRTTGAWIRNIETVRGHGRMAYHNGHLFATGSRQGSKSVWKYNESSGALVASYDTGAATNRVVIFNSKIFVSSQRTNAYLAPFSGYKTIFRFDEYLTPELGYDDGNTVYWLNDMGIDTHRSQLVVTSKGNAVDENGHTANVRWFNSSLQLQDYALIYDVTSTCVVTAFANQVLVIPPPSGSRFICGGYSYYQAPVYCSWFYNDSFSLLKPLQSFPNTNEKISYDSAVDPIDQSFYSLYFNNSTQKGEVWKYDKSARLKTSWGTGGKIAFPYEAKPFACAVDSFGNLYVGIRHDSSQPAHDTLYKYDINGNLVWSTHSSSIERWFNYIIVSGGYGYCVEYNTGIPPYYFAKKFSLENGSFLQTYTPTGGVVYPYGLAVDSFGFVYISTTWVRIERFTNNGVPTNYVDLYQSAPIETQLSALLAKSGETPSDTTIYVGGYKRNAATSTNLLHIWKYNHSLQTLLSSKLLNSTYGSHVDRISPDIENKMLVMFAPQNNSHTSQIVEMSCLDLSVVQSLTFPNQYYGFLHCSRQVIPNKSELLDMNFAQMIKELLINERYGGYSESDLIAEDFDSIILHCEIYNLKGSLVVNDQKPLPDWIAYICSHFQGYFYEIGGKVGLNCYRSQSSVLSLTQDDLIRDTTEEPPVHITKRAYSATFNRLEATWTNRANNYKIAAVPAFDRIDQRESGQVRTKTLDLKAITNKELASKMAWRLFIDQIYRFSQYSFKLGYKSMLLEVGDVIDVTDGYLLSAKKMRVMSVNEERDGRKAVISAVEDISDYYPVIQYAIQDSQAEADVPIVLTDGVVAFRESYNSNKLYLSITPGGVQCNGFYIYKSYDNVSYSLAGKAAIGEVTGGEANSTGTLQSSLPAHTAVIHRRNEFFDVSIGTITDLDTAIADSDFFNNRRLAKVGDEIIAYRTCVESAVEGTWRVSNLIRGLFGTRPVAHSPGETFSTLNIDFVYNLQESDIGKTLYFKVVSFYANEFQLISAVSPFSYQVQGLWQRPAAASLLRLSSTELEGGATEYKGSGFTLYWNLAGKKGTGWNQGGFDLNSLYPEWRYGDDVSKLVGGSGVSFNNYVADDELQGIDLVFEKTDSTFISQRSVVATARSAAIDKVADLGNNSVAVIKVYPRRAYRTEKAEPLTVTGA